MVIVTKHINGRDYLYEQHSHRDDNGKVYVESKYIGPAEGNTQRVTSNYGAAVTYVPKLYSLHFRNIKGEDVVLKNLTKKQAEKEQLNLRREHVPSTIKQAHTLIKSVTPRVIESDKDRTGPVPTKDLTDNELKERIKLYKTPSNRAERESKEEYEKELKSRHSQNKMEKVMEEFKEGKIKTSYGKKVTKRGQAIAIGIAEQKRFLADNGKVYDTEKEVPSYTKYRQTDGYFKEQYATPEDRRQGFSDGVKWEDMIEKK
jgi:hypothetical protein